MPHWFHRPPTTYREFLAGPVLPGPPAGRRAVIVFLESRVAHPRSGRHCILSIVVGIRMPRMPGGPALVSPTIRVQAYGPEDFDAAYNYYLALGGRPGPGMDEAEFAAWWAAARAGKAAGATAARDSADGARRRDHERQC